MSSNRDLVVVILATMDDLVVVVTGASAGIGAEIARQATAAGARVALAARREPELKAIADELIGSMAVVVDVTKRSEVERLSAEVIDKYGHYDIWINNVGRGISRLPSEITDEDIDTMMEVNVKSALYGMQVHGHRQAVGFGFTHGLTRRVGAVISGGHACVRDGRFCISWTAPLMPPRHRCQVAAAHMKHRGKCQIINISSELGRVPTVLPRTAYSGAKHFLNALTDGFRSELAASYPNLAVTSVSPGLTYTEFHTRARHGGGDGRAIPGGQVTWPLKKCPMLTFFRTKLKKIGRAD